MCKKKETENDRMRRAYGVTGRLLRDQMRRERPGDADELASVRPAEVVSVHGQYDHIHRVLEATGVPFVAVEPDDLHRADWQRMQVLLVNCPGQLPDRALRRIGPWVRQGGYLVTTDWALRHVVEPLFPNTVRHNGRKTADCVVRVELQEDGEADPLLEGFLEDGRDPLWWLEGSSYPIEILDRERVRVLARSRELADRWGEEPVIVTFEEGEGTVLHLVSHLYLQRSDVRGERDSMAAADYFAQELSLGEDELALYAGDSAGLVASEAGSALSKARMMARVVLDSRRKAKRRRRAKS